MASVYLSQLVERICPKPIPTNDKVKVTELLSQIDVQTTNSNSKVLIIAISSAGAAVLLLTSILVAGLCYAKKR